MLQLFLFLHVMGAIVVFGPTFVFPILARFVRQSPQNGHFAAEVGHFIESRIVLPGVFVQLATGIALVFLIGAQTQLTSPAYRWLVAAIVLYAIAIAYAVLVQAPAAAKMVELTAGGPPPAAVDGAPRPAGPPPAIAANAQKLQRGGMILTVLLVLIVILMVTKPGY
jgi:hypothetical protein